MLGLVALAALGTFTATPVRADLGKNFLFPNGLPFPELDSLATPTAQIVDVVVPDICTSHATDNKCDLDAVEAFEVTYSDCSAPWTLCRCGNAETDKATMAAQFGRVPPGIRSYVGGALAVEGTSCSAGSSGDFIVFTGQCVEAVYIHESGHSLDHGESPLDAFQAALNASTCVPDAYANTNPAEDFAQLTVTYAYLTKVGVLPNGTDPACLQPQLDIFSNTPRIASAFSATMCDPSIRPFTITDTALTPGQEANKTLAELEAAIEHIILTFRHAN